jgi:glycosyltransferase involved in cell wall biosynthesis
VPSPRNRQINVLHCPESVGGNPQSLAKAERSQGLNSWAVMRTQTKFLYPGDEVLFTGKESGFVKLFKLFWLILRAARWADVIHYNFGDTILPFPVVAGSKYGWLGSFVLRLLRGFDLRVFFFMRKPIFVCFQGCDARQEDFSVNNYDITFVHRGYYPEGSDQRKRDRIKMFERFASGIFALNPDLLHVLPPCSKFLPYANLDYRLITPSHVRRWNRLVIGHAPSSRHVKGTKYILDAVAKLKDEGFGIDLKLIENMSNSDALREYQDCDFMIDQLLAGWYGGLAVECMAMGKPVICYIRRSDSKFIPAAMQNELPIINATPASIYEVLRSLFDLNEQEYEKRSRLSRKFVERWHDPVKIAAYLADEYRLALSKDRSSLTYASFIEKIDEQ